MKTAILYPTAYVLIAAGILGLCQPWSLALYTHGFAVLLAGTALIIVASHLR